MLEDGTSALSTSLRVAALESTIDVLLTASHAPEGEGAVLGGGGGACPGTGEGVVSGDGGGGGVSEAELEEAERFLVLAGEPTTGGAGGEAREHAGGDDEALMDALLEEGECCVVGVALQHGAKHH